MNTTCRLGGAAALAAIIAATAFVSEASANPFNFFGQPLFGYGPPTDNGNQARAGSSTSATRRGMPSRW